MFFILFILQEIAFAKSILQKKKFIITGGNYHIKNCRKKKNKTSLFLEEITLLGTIKKNSWFLAKIALIKKVLYFFTEIALLKITKKKKKFFISSRNYHKCFAKIALLKYSYFIFRRNYLTKNLFKKKKICSLFPALPC